MITRIFSLGWRVKDPCVPSHDYPPPRKVRAGITVFFLFEDARLCLSCTITLLGMSIESNWQFLQLSSRNFFLFLATSRRRACFLVRIHRAIALKGAIPPLWVGKSQKGTCNERKLTTHVWCRGFLRAAEERLHPSRARKLLVVIPSLFLSGMP